MLQSPDVTHREAGVESFSAMSARQARGNSIIWPTQGCVCSGAPSSLFGGAGALATQWKKRWWVWVAMVGVGLASLSSVQRPKEDPAVPVQLPAP